MYRFLIPAMLSFLLIAPIETDGGTMLNPRFSKVEEVFLNHSGRQSSYSQEKIPVIETENVCHLGKLTALRFIEWVQQNPDGVIALPTGKTPELFIEYLKHYKQNWREISVQNDLKYYGIEGDNFPDTKNLKFVQIDEFYPINVENKNSFTHYINKYYINLLDIEPQNILSMDFASVGILKEKGIENVFPGGRVDFTLMDRREPKNQKETWQKQALLEAGALSQVYEKQIRNWGGIGFFLGGIGPDGHIAFNMEGSPLQSGTRLVKLNYQSAAAAASSLGGIEYSRDKTAVTIGLGTITFNKSAALIIMAAGEAKAAVVANAVQHSKSNKYPASSLQGLPLARFYVTRGAASHLIARKLEDVRKNEHLSDEMIDDIIIELALSKNKALDQLTRNDFSGQKRAKALLERVSGDVGSLAGNTKRRLIAKIQKGLDFPKQENILHTAPHHDDVMLSYHPLLKPLLEQNNNYFVYLTSGFNSVTDSYIVKKLNHFRQFEIERKKDEIFNKPYKKLVEEYVTRARQDDQRKMDDIEAIILLKNTAKVYGLDSVSSLKEKINWLSFDYFQKKIPGEKDGPSVQMLKGMMRESESDRMLALADVPLSNITHLRSKFYTGDYFNPMPSIEKDAEPVRKLYEGFQPSIITVAVDPEGTGPDTHYKVLQVVAEALRMEKNMNPKIWGYRNVWFRFSPSEATTMVPVSEDDIECLNKSFMYCFSTQKSASFPSPEFDGPFSGMAKFTQQDQYRQLKTLLGAHFFEKNSDARIQKASGFIYIKEMDKDAFLNQAQELKKRIEL